MTDYECFLAFGVPPAAAVTEKAAALTPAELLAAADETATPTAAQKESGNYKKGRVRWKGLELVIETPKGRTRSGTSAAGKKWSTVMKDHYGYVGGTKSRADGDAVDFFLSDAHLDSEVVFVVNQYKADGTFDEHKCVLGCVSEAEAREAYLRNYSPGWTGLGSVRPMTLPDFKAWLETKPEKAAADALNATIDRPKGFKKVFHTAAGPKEMTYPLNYGFFPGVINPEDGEEADVFVGSGGPLHGRFMKGRPGPDGKMVPDERKWYGGLTRDEYAALRSWWDTEHDAGLTWDWTDLGDREGLLRDAGVEKQAADEDTPEDLAEDEAELKRLQAEKRYLGRYKCPHCGGTNMFNGIPGTGTTFRGSGHCQDCDKGCSIVGLKLKPIGDGPEIVSTPDQVAAWRRNRKWARKARREAGLAKTGFEAYAPHLVLVKRAADGDHPFTVAVDLDGTLAEPEEPFDPDSIGPPRERAVAWVRLFHDAGARIIIFTVRGTRDLVEAWLDEHDVPYDFVNENPDQPDGASGKVLADVYWDDRAVNAENPDETGPEILRRIRAAGGGDADQGPVTITVQRTVVTISGPDLLEALEHGRDD